MVDQKKLKKAIKNLEHALTFEDRIEEDQFYMAGISKCYEVCLEYAWKYLKSQIVDQGLEAYGPKDVLKMAGQLNMIDNVEAWINFINERNLAVHDYATVTDQQYLSSAKHFLEEVQKIK